MRMSREVSEATGKPFPVDALCRLLEVPKSSFYEYRRQRREAQVLRERKDSGPKKELDDAELLVKVREVLWASPFHTEGYKKVRIRLKKKGIKAAKHRVLRVMRQAGLLSPQRTEQKAKKKHEGTIIPKTINEIWGTDGTMFGTETGQLLWLFAVVDHFSDEVLGWHIVEVGQGTRWAALEPVKQGLRKVCGAVAKGVGGEIAVRHDWGPQYTAKDFKKELEYWGLANSPALMHEPETNGVIERFFRTLKEECLWIERFRDAAHAREVVGRWMETYNREWLIERNGYRTPREVRESCEVAAQVA
jgi:putative transposase